MKNSFEMLKVIRGNFANGKNADGSSQKGNFTAYSDMNEQIFGSKALLVSVGWDTFAKVKFPFWVAIKENNAVGQLQADNKTPARDDSGNLVLSSRLEIGAIYKTEDAMLDAMDLRDSYKDKLQERKALKQITFLESLKATASAKGLSEKVIDKVLQDSLI